MTDTTMKASWEILEVKRPEGNESFCTAGYTARFTLSLERGNESATCEATVGGWVNCGWLKPGANSDLDGSGLALWGNSQPGGWTQCDGDGQSDGRPWLEADGTTLYVCDNYVYGAGESTSFDLLKLAHWLSEAEAAALVEDIVFAHRECDSPDIDEPTAEEIARELGCDDDNPIVMGNYCDAGRVLAWVNREGEVRSTYWPNEREIRVACDEAHRRMANDAAAELIGQLNEDDQ